MSYKEIQQELDGQLTSITGLPEVVLENTRFKAMSKTPFIRSTLLPSQSTVETIGTTGYNKVYGLYQIDIFYPLDGGYEEINDDADTIISNFTKGTSFAITNGTLRINISWRNSGRKLENFYNIPVLVSWECYI